ncbi:MAG: ABC transporter permease [Acetatifactor sp.]
MIRFELKKIFKSRMNQVAMTLGIVLLLVVYFSQNFGGDSIYCETTDSYLTGSEAVRYSREKAASQGETLTEAMVDTYLRKLQAYPGNLDSDEAYLELYRKDAALLYYLIYSYCEVGEIDFNRIKELDLSEGPGFYQWRMDKIDRYLSRSSLYGPVSDCEKEFWLEKAAKVSTPFAWGSRAPATRINELVTIAFYLLAVIIVCISPMFSKECDTGAAHLLLTTKYGKTGLIRAKAVAAYVFTVSYLLGCTLLSVLVQGMTSGFAELSLPIQLWNNAIPYGMNMGQVCLLQTLMILCIGAALVAIMLFTSALTKSTIGTMSLALLLLIVPVFLPYSKDNGLFNRLLELCFVQLANVKELMGKFVSYRIGSLVFDQLTMGMLVWGIVAAVLLIPLRRVFVTQIVK